MSPALLIPVAKPMTSVPNNALTLPFCQMTGRELLDSDRLTGVVHRRRLAVECPGERGRARIVPPTQRNAWAPPDDVIRGRRGLSHHLTAVADPFGARKATAQRPQILKVPDPRREDERVSISPCRRRITNDLPGSLIPRAKLLLPPSVPRSLMVLASAPTDVIDSMTAGPVTNTNQPSLTLKILMLTLQTMVPLSMPRTRSHRIRDIHWRCGETIDADAKQNGVAPREHRDDCGVERLRVSSEVDVHVHVKRST